MKASKPRHTEASIDRTIVELFDWRSQEEWQSGWSEAELISLINARNQSRCPLNPESAEDRSCCARCWKV
ncbi:MAG: hypothetical protein R3E89_16460 [Thiolinea sp.]